jgi:hypothetical protein
MNGSVVTMVLRLLPMTCCHAYKLILNWVGFGRIAGTMVSPEKSNCSSIIYAPAPAARCTTRAEKLSHKGMKISESDWSVFLGHAGATMKALQVPQRECDEVAAFVLSLKKDIVEV